MPTVTALKEEPRGRVAVELDGVAWRSLPQEVIVRGGLSVGRALDRPALRLVRRELRRSEALAVAARALRARDFPSRRLAARLDTRVAPAARDEALLVLERAGLVDDARFATSRAAVLAARGCGNAAIRFDLERQGVAADLCQQALDGLGTEVDRARAVVARRGSGLRTARFLAGKGFEREAIEAALGADFANDP